MRKVLCVCVGNQRRSPMMAALLKRELGPDFHVQSVGIGPSAYWGNPASKHSVTCLLERGIDIRDHSSRHIGSVILAEFTYIVCAGEAEQEEVFRRLNGNTTPIVQIANRHGGGIPDPDEKGALEDYKKCAALIEAEMRKAAALILL